MVAAVEILGCSSSPIHAKEIILCFRHYLRQTYKYENFVGDQLQRKFIKILHRQCIRETRPVKSVKILVFL